MRGQHHLRQGAQAFGHAGLVVEHVQPGAGDHGALQRVDQRGLVHHRATRHVHQDAAGRAAAAQRGQHLGVDQVAGAGAAGGDDHQEITFFGQRGGAGQVAVRQVGLGAAGGVGDGHAEGLGPVGDGLADAAHADDAHACAAHLARQRHVALQPVTTAHETVGRRQLARGAQHQAQGQVGHVVVQHIGRVGHHHAAGLGGGHVDTVVAHAHHRDHLQRGQLRDEVGRHLAVAAGGHGADARRHGGQAGGVQVGQHMQLEGGRQLRHVQRRQAGHGQHGDGVLINGHGALLGLSRLLQPIVIP